MPFFKKTALFAAFFGFSASIFGQKVLTADDAVALALEKNLGISIARNEIEAARALDTRGLAGLTPDLTITATDNAALNFTRQTFSNDNKINRNAVPANNLNVGGQLSWTIFDGGRAATAKKRFGKLTELEEIQLQTASIDLAAQVLQLYWSIWRDERAKEPLQKLIESTAERRRLAETRWQLGLASKVDFLQAEIDLNTFSANLERQKTLVEQGKRRLETLLGGEGLGDFEVEKTLLKTDLPTLSDEALEVNSQLLQFRKQLEINELEQKELTASNHWRLAATGQLGYQQTNNPASFLTFNQTAAPAVGLNFQWPILDGGRTDSRIAASKIVAKNIALARQNLESQFEADLKNAYAEHVFQQKALEAEDRNLALAEENLTISMERLRLAAATSLEIRQAQVLFENAANRRDLALFALKSAEIRVRQLIGKF